MALDPHERAAINRRIAELDTHLERLAPNPSIVERMTKSVALQFEIGELLRKIPTDLRLGGPLIVT